MKPKKVTKSFYLNKKTISNLDTVELDRAKGGATWKCPTDPMACDTYADCTYTWYDFCTEGFAC
jgi:hypothetical protein